MKLISEQLLDYFVLGYSPQGNPMRGLRERLPELPNLTSAEFRKLKRNVVLAYAGVVTVLQRPPPAKGTAFMTLEDEFGSVDAIFSKDVYEKHRSIIRSSRFLIVRGRVQLNVVRTPQGIFEVRVLYAHDCAAFGHASESKPVRPQQHPRSLGRLSGEYCFGN